MQKLFLMYYYRSSTDLLQHLWKLLSRTVNFCSLTTDLCVNPLYIKRSLGEGIYNTCFTYTTVTLSFWPVAIPNRSIISAEEYFTLYSAFKLCHLLSICKTHRLANLLVLEVTKYSYIHDDATIKHVGLPKLMLILRKMIVRKYQPYRLP